MTVEQLLSAEQYSLARKEKESLLLERLVDLTEHHRERCSEYSQMLAAIPRIDIRSLADVPFLPVSMFKTHRLASITDEHVFKILTSSGTTGQQVSKITLDRDAANLQSRALAAIMTHTLGTRRLPMIIVDTPNVVRDRKSFSARGAGVLGMMSYGRKHFYALDDDMNLDVEGLDTFLTQYFGEPILIFGFTFMVWKYLLERVGSGDIDLSQSTVIHSGGWKKLQDEAVNNAEFKKIFRQRTGATRIHNFYGMVEQIGSVFMEGGDGYLYPPNFADVIIRDPISWAEVPDGEPGVIQVLSALPTSYPGHSLLTEDLGIVHGFGDHRIGRGGRRLEVLGRVPKAELRGCSDTHAADAQTPVTSR